MFNESIAKDIRNTLRDAHSLDNGAEGAAHILLQDVDQAQRKYGSNSREFNQYVSGLCKELTEQGLMPELALGFAKNNFQELDIDEKDGVSKVELFMANERSSNQLEKQLTATLIAGFREVRSAHESNKFIPFASDANGITEADLSAKMKEATDLRDDIHDHHETFKEAEFVSTIAWDLTTHGGRLFDKIARGDRDGDRTTIDKDDLEDLLERDLRERGYSSRELSDRERKVVEYLLNNWDNESVMSLRADIHSYDSSGNEFVHEGFGDLTKQSLRRVVSRLESDPVPPPAEAPVRHKSESKPHVEKKETPPSPRPKVEAQPPKQDIKPQDARVLKPCVEETTQNRMPARHQYGVFQPPARQEIQTQGQGYRQGQTPYDAAMPVPVPVVPASRQQRPIRPAGYEREIDQSSEFYQGGGMALGRQNYRYLEQAGGYRPYANDMAPPLPQNHGFNTFLDGLERLNRMSAPWLVWDAQKQANRYNNPYNRTNPYLYGRGW